MIVNLNWNVSACSGTTGYNIYRSQSADGDYLQVAANVNGPPYVDQPPTLWGSSWFYKVSSVDLDGEGDLSASIEAAAPDRPSAPTNLSTIVTDGCTGPAGSGGYGIGGYGLGGYG